jgi:hypothetical protein
MDWLFVFIPYLIPMLLLFALVVMDRLQWKASKARTWTGTTKRSVRGGL